MPRYIHQRPPIRYHAASRRAYVTLYGFRMYLGKPGDWDGAGPRPRTIEADYYRLTRDHDPHNPPAWARRKIEERSFRRGEKAAGPVSDPEPLEDATVAVLADAAQQDAERRYVKNGRPTAQLFLVRSALKHLLEAIDPARPADSVRPADLTKVMDSMLAAGYVRGTVQAYMGIIRRVFKLGGKLGLCRPGLWFELKVVDVPAGAAPRGQGRQPVSVADVVRTLPHLDAAARDLIRFLGVTACRPEEGCIARARDFIHHARHGRVYSPWHKTDHHGLKRYVPITDAAWKIVGPLIAAAPSPDAYLFSNPRARKPSHYDRNGLCHEVARACEAAFPPPGALAIREDESDAARLRRLNPKQREALKEWTARHRWNPSQLRHTKLTQLRHRQGLEAAQLAAGHTTSRMTEHYAELTPDPLDIDTALVWKWRENAPLKEIIEAARTPAGPAAPARGATSRRRRAAAPVEAPEPAGAPSWPRLARA